MQALIRIAFPLLLTLLCGGTAMAQSSETNPAADSASKEAPAEKPADKPKKQDGTEQKSADKPGQKDAQESKPESEEPSHEIPMGVPVGIPTEVPVEVSVGAPIGVPEEVKVEDIAQTLTENEAASLMAPQMPAAKPPEFTVTRRVAVYNFELQNVPPGIGQVVTDALLAEVRKMEGVSAIGMEEITQMISLEAQKQMLGCEASESCLAQIGGALGVDELITGTLTELADGRVILIRRIDQRQAKIIQSIQKRLKVGSGEEFLLAIEPSVKELYAGRAYRPGTKPGVPDELVLRLNPPPVPGWLTRTLGWAGAGLATTAGITYGATWMYHGNRSDALRDGTENSGTRAAASSRVGKNLEVASQTMVISSIILGAAFGALYAITDWEDTDDSE